MRDRLPHKPNDSQRAMLWRLSGPVAFAFMLFQPLASCATAGSDAAVERERSVPDEALVTSISSIKRLTDGTLSCAQLQSRMEVLQGLSREAERQAEATMSAVEQAQAELTASATISQASAPTGLALGTAVTLLEAIPLAGNVASSFITPSPSSPSLPPRSGEAQVSTLHAVLDASRSQIAQFATASRHDHLRQLHARSHCATRFE